MMAKESGEEIYENARIILKGSKKTAKSPSRRLWWCLGISFLSFLLVGSVVVNVWMGLEMYEHKTTVDLLMMRMGNLQNHSEELVRNNSDMDILLESILKFKNFPVSEYCNGKKCQLCQKGWIRFQNHCYLFFNATPWKTWEKSQEHCKSKSADLVVVNDLQEQEFLSNHSTYYFDEFHGYWLGLHKEKNTWVWTDGRNETLGYWMQTNIGGTGPYALLIPRRTPTESWDTSDSAFLNKFICEQEVLITPETKAKEASDE